MTNSDKNIMVPDWMKAREAYEPSFDRESFIIKTSKSLMKILSRFRQDNIKECLVSPESSIFTTFIYILLIALSSDLTIPSVILGYGIIRVAFLSGEQIRKVFGMTLTAILLSLLFLAPAAVMGHLSTVILMIIKVFISVFLLSILSHSYTINRIAQSLRMFHIPGIIIFILDTTIKYIFILGNLCLELLDALKLRSVGWNKDKQKSAAGIMGITYLKSRKMAEETLDAMTCRCFDGNYQLPKQKRNWKKRYWYDILNIIICIFVCILYVYNRL